MSIIRIGLALGAMAVVAIAACGGDSDSSASGGGTSSASSTGSSGGGGAGGTGGTGGTGGSTPIVRPAPPQVVKFNGAVIAAPKVQPIVYAADTAQADLMSFLADFGASSSWTQIAAEYGVGSFTTLPAIVISDAPPAEIDDEVIQQNLAMNLTGAVPAWGAADPNTIYLFLYPAPTIVTSQGARGCHDYDGYHDEAPISAGVEVAYAIVDACPRFDGPGVSDIQQRTVAISHELIEAATDPFPNSKPAYAQTDEADLIWSVETGGEVADMCEFNEDSYFIPPGASYMMQRSWSNVAARAGKNPCVPPATTDPYFESVPILPDTLHVSGGGASFSTSGVKIPVGGSVTIPVSLHSTAPTKGPWKVHAYDGAELNTGTRELDVSLDKESGSDGDVLHLTIKVLKADGLYGVGGFILFSDLDGQETITMGAVGQQ